MLYIKCDNIREKVIIREQESSGVQKRVVYVGWPENVTFQ